LHVYAEHVDDGTGLVHVRPLKLRFAPMKPDADVQLRWYTKTGRITDLTPGQEPKDDNETGEDEKGRNGP